MASFRVSISRRWASGGVTGRQQICTQKARRHPDARAFWEIIKRKIDRRLPLRRGQCTAIPLKQHGCRDPDEAPMR